MKERTEWLLVMAAGNLAAGSWRRCDVAVRKTEVMEAHSEAGRDVRMPAEGNGAMEIDINTLPEVDWRIGGVWDR